MPVLPAKLSEPSFVNAVKYREYLQGRGRWPTMPAPKSVILCYQTSIYSHILKQHSVVKCDGTFSNLLFLEETNRTVAVMGNFGIGSPMAGIMLEELISFGVSQFISFGTAGGLANNLKIGELLLCSKALRDEGVSSHYLAPERFVQMDEHLTEQFRRALKAKGIDFKEGPTWTTDAPYRETKLEVTTYAQEGILSVEMEAAALAAVAKYHGVRLAAAFTISDLLSTPEWHPEFHSNKTEVGLEQLFQAAVAALRENN